jgi:glycine/D-amino acid oxidase-like deaminating enzyme
MITESIETVIVGAGQAGLSTGYHLRKRGREFVILDGNARLGDNWRAQWDTLRLYTPRKYDGLPGLPFPGERWSYPGKDEVADYLESYATRFDLPVRTSTRVDRLDKTDGGYVVTTGDHQILARNVVVATGTFGRTPYLPEYAVDLDPAIRPPVRRGRPAGPGSGLPGPDVDVRRRGAGRARAAGRGDGGGRGRRTLADLRGQRLLRDDRGLPGGARLRPRLGVDHRTDPLV